MGYTVSVHCGSRLSRGHNIRDWRITQAESHINPEGIHEVWADETERHAYHRLFDGVQRRYNARQTRSDRKINDYYAQIKKDAKKHTAYEMIISIGNKDNPPPEETGKEIMREFVDEWEAFNPCMKIIGAYYHADEEGVPHVHIDYIPVADDYKRGMEIQTSNTKACAEMGFTGPKGVANWWASERNRLEDVCIQYGLEVDSPKTGAKHVETELFKTQKDLNRAKEEFEELRTDEGLKKISLINAILDGLKNNPDSDLVNATKENVSVIIREEEDRREWEKEEQKNRDNDDLEL